MTFVLFNTLYAMPAAMISYLMVFINPSGYEDKVPALFRKLIHDMKLNSLPHRWFFTYNMEKGRHDQPDPIYRRILVPDMIAGE